MDDVNEFWGGSDFIYTCLIDKKRTTAFKAAILNAVKKGDIVADIGSGTGILALFALEAGAKMVYVVEADKNIFSVLKKNFSSPSIQKRITLINADATKVNFPENLDVVICELIATGLIDEYQIPVMNHIQKFIKNESRVIPDTITSYVDLVQNKNVFYGHKLNIVRYEYGDYVNNQTWESKSLSNKIPYSTVCFHERNTSDIEIDLNLDIQNSGIINGIRITSKTLFPSGETLHGTLAYCMPLILPVDDIKVKTGDQFNIKLRYQMCSSLDELQYEINQVA